MDVSSLDIIFSLSSSTISAGGGGSSQFEEIVKSYNPIVFPELKEALRLFFSGSKLDSVLGRTWDVFRLSLAFVFRQPAYLGENPVGVTS